MTCRASSFRLAVLALLVVSAGCGAQSLNRPRPSPTLRVTATPSSLPLETPSPEPEPIPLPPTPLPILPSSTPSQVPQTPVVTGLPADLRGTEWSRLPTARPIVALTFDAGSGAQGVPSILATLARENVPATFFLTGRWIATYPDMARRIADVQAHSIGNHTMDHPDLTTLGDAQVLAQLTDAQRWIQSVTGRDPRPLFRFPYGARDARTLALANGLGYGGIRWTVDSLGWKGASAGQSLDTVVSRALTSAQDGEIILMHVGAAPDGSTLDADALPRVISGLRQRGYQFVAIWDFIYSR